MANQIGYPDGRSRKAVSLSDNHARRGTLLEDDINASNEFYRQRKRALIYKKPTPVQIVRVDYPRRGKARITEAYYRTPSTTDYNGIYRGRYIDFEAKETKNKTSFPKYLVQPHQIEHLKDVLYHGGIGFFIIRFSLLHETWLVDAAMLIEIIQEDDRASIPHSWFLTNGERIKEGYLPRLNYLDVVDAIYIDTEKGEENARK